jgi:Recombinase
VGLEFLDQTFVDDGESEIGALMEGLQALLPSIDRRTIMRRFARGKRRVTEEGFSWAGTAPYGYAYTPGGQEQHSWAKAPEEVPHVVDIFTWAAEGLSRSAIARRLRDEGVKTRKGGEWWESTVRGIIQNPRYKGEFPIGRFIASYAQLVERQRRWRAQLEAARAQVRKYQETLDRLDLAYYSQDLPPDRYERLRSMAEEQLRTAQEECTRAEAEAGPEAGIEPDARANLFLELSRAFAGLQGPPVDDAAIRAAIRRAADGLLGHATRAELEALDLEGRRRKVRMVVERVVLAPEGPSVVLVPGGGHVDFTDGAWAGYARRRGRGSGAGPGRARGRRGG